MKKLISLIGSIVLVAATSQTAAQKDRKLTSGFSINLVTGFPSSDYGLVKGDNVGSEYETGNIWGAQVGNRWYFNPTEQYGLGLMVNWADISVAARAGSDYLGDWGRSVVDMSFLEVGPIGTYALSDKVALDAYYNLRPTAMATVFLRTFPSGGSDDVQTTYSGFGFTHALGAALRYNIFNFGMEYVMGGIDCAGETKVGVNTTTLDNEKRNLNSFRILLGVKF
jgi:hypothetical protein